MRLDVYLVQKGLVQSRSRAKALIDKGVVQLNGSVVTKSSTVVPEGAKVSLLEEDHPYVSRAAFKLKALVDTLGHSFEGAYVLDVGASTGGFTQVALEKGAKHVYSVDVGTGQLHESLRKHPRVTNIEQTDARDVHRKMFKVEPSILICDMSFISLTKVMPALLLEMDSLFHLYILVKPQFEVGKAYIDKNGIVKNEERRLKALSDIEICVQDLGFEVVHDMASPLSGGDGNIEYLIYAERP